MHKLYQIGLVLISVFSILYVDSTFASYQIESVPKGPKSGLVELAPETRFAIDAKRTVGSTNCWEVENSCSIKFLESLLCNIGSYMCVNDGQNTKFSWELASAYHTAELSSFAFPDLQTIHMSTENFGKKMDFVNHEHLEYLICKLDEEICIQESIYNADPSASILNINIQSTSISTNTDLSDGSESSTCEDNPSSCDKSDLSIGSDADDKGVPERSGTNDKKICRRYPEVCMLSGKQEGRIKL